MSKVRALVATGLLGAGTLGATLVAVPASAATVVAVPVAHNTAAQPDSGWLGTCYDIQLSSTTGGGWCDGNGPDGVYRGYADCTDGHEYYGPERWAGDRRGSYATCPGGYYLTAWGVTGALL